MRKARQHAESGIYHVIARGAGRQIIFEDDHDRLRYLDDLNRFAAQRSVQILAWCLMSNHVHLLLEGEQDAISRLLQLFGSEYAQYFNKRHDRIGPLFQCRFKSEPVETDAYLITVVRYIHENPARAGMAPTASYRWSSYSEYATTPRCCHTARVLDVMGSKEQFIQLHGLASGASGYEIMEHENVRGLHEDALIEWAVELLGEETFRHLKELPKAQRNRAVGELRRGGLSIRQIERISGIGRGIISRVRCDKVT